MSRAENLGRVSSDIPRYHKLHSPHTKAALGLGVFDRGLPIREILVDNCGHDSACTKVSNKVVRGTQSISI